MKRLLIAVIHILIALGSIRTDIWAQGATVKLSTNDNTSSFNVTNNTGTSLFKVDGSGAMSGDGSGLSNLRPRVAYAGGNSNIEVTSYDPYGPTLIKSVELTVPGPGIIIVQATGYIRYHSPNVDYIRASIIDNAVATHTTSFGNHYFYYLFVSCDFNTVDTTDIYSSLALSRTFTVSSAATYRYNLWADKATDTCLTQIGDANMQAIYIPTGGTGPVGLMAKTSNPDESGISDLPLIPGSMDGHSPPPAISTISPTSRNSSTEDLNALKTEIAIVTADNQALKEELNALKIESTATSTTNQALKTELSLIRDENKTLKSHLEAIERRLSMD